MYKAIIQEEKYHMGIEQEQGTWVGEVLTCL